MVATQVILTNKEIKTLAKYAEIHKDGLTILQVSSSAVGDKIEVGTITKDKQASDWIIITDDSRIKDTLDTVTNLLLSAKDKIDESRKESDAK